MPSRNDRDRQLRDRLCGWIRHEMWKAEIGQNDIAKLMGMRSGTLSRYMQGDEVPSCGFVLAVATALHEVALSTMLLKDPPPEFIETAPYASASSVLAARQREPFRLIRLSDYRPKLPPPKG